MRFVLVLLGVVGFVAFASSLPVSDENSKSTETEEFDVLPESKESLEGERTKRMADSSSSSSEETKDKKVEKKPEAAAAVEEEKADSAARRRKRCSQHAVPSVDVSLEEHQVDVSEEKSDPTSDSKEVEKETVEENENETKEDSSEN